MKYPKQGFSGDLILIVNIYFAGSRALEAVWRFFKNSNSFLL